MNKLLNKLIMPLREYFIGISLLWVATVLTMINVYKSYEGITIPEIMMPLIMTFITGGFLSILLRAGIKKFGLANYYYLLIPILMLGAYYFIGKPDTYISALKFMVINGSAVLIFLGLPFIKQEEDSDYYTYKVIVAYFLTIITYIVLFAGISLTIFSVSLLFEFKIAGYVYSEVMVFLIGFVATSVFLALIPTDELLNGEYPKFNLRVVSYAVVPILSVYTVVLYAYLLKVLFQFKLPLNTLGNLVIYYALISVVILYFNYRVDFEHKIINKFMNLLPFVLIIPVLVMVLSFMVRISNYGITEPRYYAILVAIFVLGSIFLLKKFGTVKYIPLLLAGLLLISILGPVSSYSISSYSQEARLRSVLKEKKMLVGDELTPNADLGSKDRYEIISVVRYFSNRDELSKLEFLPAGFEMKDFKEVFGFTEWSFTPDVVY